MCIRDRENVGIYGYMHRGWRGSGGRRNHNSWERGREGEIRVVAAWIQYGDLLRDLSAIAEVAAEYHIRLGCLHAMRTIQITDGKHHHSAVGDGINQVAFGAEQRLAPQVFRQLKFLAHSEII